MKTNVNLTTNEKAILVALVDNAEYSGDTGTEYTVSETAQRIDKSISSVNMTIRSLAKKGLVNPCGKDSYFDGYITDEGFALVNDLKGEEKTEEVEETGKAEKVENSTTTRRSKKEVGDIHPNGKWIWREYQPGKFDWRVITPEEKKVWDSIRTVHDEDAWFCEVEQKFGTDIAHEIISQLDNNDFRGLFRYAMRLSKKVRKQCLDIVGCNPEE